MGSLILFFFNVSMTIISQVSIKTDLDFLYETGEEICSVIKRKPFCKAFYFYRNHEYDSCYVYSNKILSTTLPIEEKDLFNYIQGVSALNKKNYKKATQNFNEISSDWKLKNLKYLKLGETYLFREEYDRAIYYYQQWNKSNTNTNLIFKKKAYHHLALCYLHKKEYPNAKRYFDKEFKLIRSIDTLEVITYKMELANSYYEQYQDKIAIPLFEEAYQLASSFSDLKIKQNTAKNLAIVSKNKKNYKKSVLYYEEYNRWKDSIWNREKIWELTERDKHMAVSQKEKEIELHKLQLKQQNIQRRNLLIGGLGLVVFIGFLGYFNRRLSIKNKLIVQQKEALAIANKTKDYLFSVVSHDLRSPINTLKNEHQHILTEIQKGDLLKIEKHTKTAKAITEDTFHLLNNILHWSLEQSNQLIFNQNTYPLSTLVAQVWYNFENIAAAKEISFINDVEEDVLVKVDRESLKIVFRNIFDNAIKYTPKKGKIHIKIDTLTKNECTFVIKDSGSGIPEEIITRINGIENLSIDNIDRSQGIGLGLLLCQTLIKKNKGTLLVSSQIDFGTQIKIVLPLIPIEEV